MTIGSEMCDLLGLQPVHALLTSEEVFWKVQQMDTKLVTWKKYYSANLPEMNVIHFLALGISLNKVENL